MDPFEDVFPIENGDIPLLRLMANILNQLRLAVYFLIYRFSTSGGAGFLPSTVT